MAVAEGIVDWTRQVDGIAVRRLFRGFGKLD